MRTLRHTLVLLPLLVAPILAQSAQLKLKNGTTVTGKAKSYDAEKKELSFHTDAGQDVTYTLDQLDGRTTYLVNASLADKNNGRGQLQLANYARDVGLYAHAARRYEYAEKADPSLKAEVEKERAIGRKLAAAYCLKTAQDYLAQGKVKDAEEFLTTLVQKLPNEPQAEEAAMLLEQHYKAERDARDDQLEKDHAELLQGDLKQGKKLYDRMIQRTQDGLTARNDSKAVNLWKDAIDDGKGVLKEIDKVAKKYADNPDVQAGAVKYRALTQNQMIDAHLHIASSSMVNSSYKEAQKQVNAALALDPKNGEALAMRARIEQATSEGIGLRIF